MSNLKFIWFHFYFTYEFGLNLITRSIKIFTTSKMTILITYLIKRIIRIREWYLFIIVLNYFFSKIKFHITLHINHPSGLIIKWKIAIDPMLFLDWKWTRPNISGRNVFIQLAFELQPRFVLFDQLNVTSVHAKLASNSLRCILWFRVCCTKMAGNHTRDESPLCIPLDDEFILFRIVNSLKFRCKWFWSMNRYQWIDMILNFSLQFAFGNYLSRTNYTSFRIFSLPLTL